MKKRLLPIGMGMILFLAILFSIRGVASSVLFFGESVVQAAGALIYLPVVDKPVPPTPTPTPTPTLTPTPTPKPTVTPTMGPAVHDVSVGLNGDQFTPSVITIHVGDTVRWTWAASFHTVTSGSVPGTADGKFCSPNNTDCSTITTSDVGAVYTHTFNQSGSFPYFCQIHWDFGMTGTVNVIP